MENKRAWIYCRVAYPDAHALAVQQASLEAYAEAHGFEVVGMTAEQASGLELTFWAEDFNQIHIFVTYNENGLVDTYRVEYGDSTIYDGEVEISFEDLYQQAEEDWRETYRAELPGTVEYQHKHEATELAAQAAASAGQRETWMSAAQQEQFRCICNLIDTIKSGRDFYRVMNQINGGRYSVDVINAAQAAGMS